MKILQFIKELFKTVIMGGVALMVVLAIILLCNGFDWYKFWVLF